MSTLQNLNIYFVLTFLTLINGFNVVFAQSRVEQVKLEHQHIADIGNGLYKNPILAGEYADPTVVRVGKDYYMTHTSYTFQPGILVWHSQDLINWKPIDHAIQEFDGVIWAPEIVYHGGLFYIYFPAEINENGRSRRSNFVISAKNPGGPWSDPVDLQVGHIDPAHAVDLEGNRYLFLSGGHMIRMAGDGKSTIGKMKKVYDGWDYPDEWIVECKCLESPKISYRDGWYYMTSAQGGTAGPSTSHMIIVARSKTLNGPWENSPINPLIRTTIKSEKWWSQGHGTLIDTPQGKWYVMYHGYRNGYRSLGRHTLLMPVDWQDGWPRIKDGVSSDDFLPNPAGNNVGHGMPLSDDFDASSLGKQWFVINGTNQVGKFHSGNGELTIEATGMSFYRHMQQAVTDISSAAMLACNPVHSSYEVSVEVEIPKTASAGMLLLYDTKQFSGVVFEDKHVRTIRRSSFHDYAGVEHNRVFLKMRNIQHDVVFYHSLDGEVWKKFSKSIDVSGFNHNVFGGFSSQRITLFASGKGKTIFKNFKYVGLE